MGARHSPISSKLYESVEEIDIANWSLPCNVVPGDCGIIVTNAPTKPIVDAQTPDTSM